MNRLLHSHRYTQNLVGRQERHARYRGTARVDVSHLSLDQGQQGQESLDPENFERLKIIFAREGCHRLDPANRIAALVSQNELATLILYSDLSYSTLLHGAVSEDKPPKLTLPANVTLRVLHGHHRLEVAKSHFPIDEAWWTVDLFLDDISSVLIGSLREEYSDLRLDSEGEIFRHIRLYHQQKNLVQEMRWWAYLTEDQVDDLKKILANQELRESLDVLLDITGLWDGFQIGTMRRYLSLKSHEVATDVLVRLVRADIMQELSTYLRHIRDVWSKITSSKTRLGNLVDITTVRNLQSRAPAASEQDASFARVYMDTGKIFAQVLDPIWRKTIINNICAIERTIPSFWTFFEDLRLLEPSAKAITMLLELQSQYKICEALRSIFIGSNCGQQRLVRQDRENHSFHIKAQNNNRFKFCYRQLWTYAIRYSPELINGDGKEEPTKDSPNIRRPKSVIWYRLTRLALRLNFRSRNTKEIGSASALDKAILDCLIWIITKGTLLKYRMTEVREKPQIEIETPLEITPSLIAESSDLDLGYRPGSAFANLQIAKLGLLIRWLYNHKKLRGKYVTSSSLQRALFQVFFGNDIGSKSKEILKHHQVDDSRLTYEDRAYQVEGKIDYRYASDTPEAYKVLGEIDDGIPLGTSIESRLSVLPRISKPFIHPRWDISLKSPISPLVAFQLSKHGLSVREDERASVLRPDGERDFLSGLTSAFAVAPSSRIVASLKTSPSTNRPSEYLAVRERDPRISEQYSDSMSCLGLGPETVSGTRVIPLDCDAGPLSGLGAGPQPAIGPNTEWRGPIDTIASQISRSEALDVSPQIFVQKSTKRIREIVAEHQTCVHDYTTSSRNLARRKNAKRNFKEYSAGLQSIHTQGVHPNSTEGCHQKRHRLSTA